MNASHRTANRVQFRLIGAAAALALGASFALAQSPAGGQGGADGQGGPPPQNNQGQNDQQGQRPQAQPAQSLSGVIESFNLSPQGAIDSLMLKTSDKLVQVNLRPGIASLVEQMTKVGDAVTASAIPEPFEADHPVFGLRTLTTANGKTIGADMRSAGKKVHAEGTIKQLNFGRRGDVNGFFMDSGQFVFFGRMDANTLKLAVGAHVEADGETCPFPNGQSMIQATTINGTKIPPPPRPDQRGEGMGRGGDRGGPGGPRNNNGQGGDDSNQNGPSSQGNGNGGGPPSSHRRGQNGPGQRPGASGNGGGAGDRQPPPPGGAGDGN